MMAKPSNESSTHKNNKVLHYPNTWKILDIHTVATAYRYCILISSCSYVMYELKLQISQPHPQKQVLCLLLALSHVVHIVQYFTLVSSLYSHETLCQ